VLIDYNRKLKERSRKLRQESALSEVLLWNQLKARKFGFQFFRQKPIGNYIVDFYCPDLKLVIEIDGSSHNSKLEYDRFRDECMKISGLNVMRFADSDVRNNLDSVLRSIAEFAAKHPPSKSPL